MTARHFLDTNVLLYSISRTPAEADKRDRAIELLDDDRGGLSVQVLQEFYVQATRSTRGDALSHDIAVDLIRTWRRFAIQDLTLDIMMQALQVKTATGYSYWDSAIIAAAQALGCDELYSEDMAHDRQIGGLRIVNPFL